MRKLSEIKNEDALDVLVELFDPVTRICKDQEVRKLTIAGDRAGAVKIAIKNHKNDVLRVLAILDGANPDEYEVNLVQIPIKVFELLNDPDMLAFFASQGLKVSSGASGSAMENTEANVQ